MDNVARKLLEFHCPRWNELPDVELYADQAVNYVEKRLEALAVGDEGRLLTTSMINNYVKLKLIPAPEKKKYGVNQMARLIVICSLKRDFSMGELAAMIDMVKMSLGSERAYDLFCDEMELNIRRAFNGEALSPVEPSRERLIVRAVMTAFANKLLAHWAIMTCGADEKEGSGQKIG